MLEEDVIWAVESKYAKNPQGHPVWNSGPPRPNAVYLLGNAALRDVTFFRGSDVLSAEDAQTLHQFFDGLPSADELVNSRMQEQPYGFVAYIRRAFEQKRTFNRNAVLDFYANPQRKELEASAIAYLKGERGQFTDAANAACHYATTGAEIAAAMERVDVFVAGIGTGGTIMGVTRRLREQWPEMQAVGVEPRLGDRLQGLRSLSEGYVPPLLDLATLSRRFLVDSASAIVAAREAMRAEGVFAGVSSGAVLHAALRVAEGMDEGNIVMMFSDGAWKYLPARPWSASDADAESLDEVHWW